MILSRMTTKIQQQIYYQLNKERIKAYAQEYRLNNPEQIAMSMKAYRENNRVLILRTNAEYKKKKVMCEACNLEVSRGSLYKHNKTQRHISNMK